jgi:hypothetical protein
LQLKLRPGGLLEIRSILKILKLIEIEKFGKLTDKQVIFFSTDYMIANFESRYRNLDLVWIVIVTVLCLQKNFGLGYYRMTIQNYWKQTNLI